jgi:protein-S-isoprenylcysteine O-methyltransferase Ste14
VLHKLVWEILKPPGGTQRQKPASPIVTLLKLVKIGALICLIVQTLALEVLPITREPWALQIVGSVIYFVGLATALLGRIHLGVNWSNLEDYQVRQEQSLVAHGLYRFIRHPIYIGDFLLLLGLQLALNSWLVLGVLILLPVIVRQASAEERLLTDAFPHYDRYRARTKRFIPYIY